MSFLKILLMAISLLLIGAIIYQIWPYLLCTLILIGIIYLVVSTAFRMNQAGYSSAVTVVVPLLVVVVGIGIGFARLGEPILLPIGSVPLVSMFVYPRIQHRRLLASYERNVAHLIKP